MLGDATIAKTASRTVEPIEKICHELPRANSGAAAKISGIASIATKPMPPTSSTVCVVMLSFPAESVVTLT